METRRFIFAAGCRPASLSSRCAACTSSPATRRLGTILAEACKRIPIGVVCLLSALHFHGLLKKSPVVWLAIDRKARRPAAEGLAVRFVRSSGEGMEQSVEVHRIGGVTVRMTTCCRIVADAFRYRNKIGLDVSLDALRACLRQCRCRKEELLFRGVINKVLIIRPGGLTAQWRDEMLDKFGLHFRLVNCAFCEAEPGQFSRQVAGLFVTTIDVISRHEQCLNAAKDHAE